MRGFRLISGWGCSALLILLLTLIEGCKERNSSILKAGKEVTFKLPGIDHGKAEIFNSLYRWDGKEYLSYYDPASPAIRYIPLEKGDPSAVPLDSLNGEGLQYYPAIGSRFSPDSLFVFLEGKSRLYRLDRQGRIRNEWGLERPDSLSHSLWASGTHFARSDGKLFIRATVRLDPFKKAARYFSIAPCMRVEFKDDRIRSLLSGGWPEKYKESCYYDTYPYRSIIERDGKSLSLYSFKASHSLFLYHKDSLLEKREARSRYIEGFRIFDTDSVGNIAYTKRFLVTSPSYGSVIEDPFRDLFYRQAFHSCRYKNPESGTVKGPRDQPWSLIVLNERFEKLGEIQMDPETYRSGPLFVSKEGLLVPRRSKNGKKERMTFTRFTVER